MDSHTVTVEINFHLNIMFELTVLCKYAMDNNVVMGSGTVKPFSRFGSEWNNVFNYRCVSILFVFL